MVIIWQVCRLIAPYCQITGSSSDNSSRPYSPYDRRPRTGSSFYHSSRYYSPYYHPGFIQEQVRCLTTHRVLTPLMFIEGRVQYLLAIACLVPTRKPSQSMPTFGTTTSGNSSRPYSSYDRPRTGSSSDNSSRPYSPYVHRRTGSVPTGHRSPSPYTQTSQSIPTFGTMTSDNSTTHRVLTYDCPRTGSSTDNSSRPYSPYGHRRTGSVTTGHHSSSPYTQTSQSIPTFGTRTYGYGGSYSRPSSPSKSWTSQSQSYTSGTPLHSFLSLSPCSNTTETDSRLESPRVSSETLYFLSPTPPSLSTSTYLRLTSTRTNR
jgi:hypothetical protein